MTSIEVRRRNYNERNNNKKRKSKHNPIEFIEDDVIEEYDLKPCIKIKIY